MGEGWKTYQWDLQSCSKDLQSSSSLLVHHPGVQSECAVVEAALLPSCLTYWTTFGSRVRYFGYVDLLFIYFGGWEYVAGANEFLELVV